MEGRWGVFFSHLVVRLWKEFGRKIQDSRLWNKLSIETLTNAGTNLFQCKSDIDCSCWNFSFRDWCFGNRWTIWLPGKNSLSNNELVTVLKDDDKLRFLQFHHFIFIFFSGFGKIGCLNFIAFSRIKSPYESYQYYLQAAPCASF